MAPPSIRSHRLLPLLAVLFFCAAAAASPEQEAVLAARTAIDLADYPRAQSIIDDTLLRSQTLDNEAVWALRVLRVELVMSRKGRKAAQTELATFTLPAKYSHSETAVSWWIMRALAVHNEKLLIPAEKLARERHRTLLSNVYLYRASLNGKSSDARKALGLAREYQQPFIEAKALTNLGLFLFRESQFTEAIERSEQAVAMAKKLQLPKLVQTAEGNLGWANFELGDYEVAETLFRNAEKRASEIGAGYDHPVWLVQLGNIEYRKRNWKQAADYNRKAAALAPGAGREEQLGYALDNLARIAIELGQFEEAAAFNRQAFKAKKGDREAELSSEVVDARIAERRGESERARKLLESVIASKPTTFTTRVEAEMHLARLHGNSGRHADARKHFRRAAAIAREGRDKIDAPDLRFAFFNTVADMYDAYVDFLIRIGAIYEALRVTESSRAQSLGEGRGVSPVFDPRQVAKANDATILCYWLGRERSYVWVVTPTEVAARTLPSDTDVEKLAREYRKEILKGNPKASVALGKELFRMLVPVRLPKDARVIVVADGQLHTLNFDTLVTPESRYWIEDVVVVSASSVQLITRNVKKTTISPSLLLLGNPTSSDPSFPVLKHAQAEIGKVASHFDRPTVLQGREATPAAFKAAARIPHDFVHFVAHGVATRQRPLDSAVILSAPDQTSSSRLRARDVVEQPLDARLVTISSCHGAGERTYVGEGLVGLAWAFLKAGADQVIAALWEVDDTATPVLMDDMYREIRAGREPADALRAAKLRMIHSKTVHRYPVYWAPFVLYAGT